MTGMTSPDGTIRRFLDRTVRMRELLPFVAVIIFTIPAAFFRLDHLADQRSEDLRAAALAEDVDDCEVLATIHTALRDAFRVVADRFPASIEVDRLADAIAEEFPMNVDMCVGEP